MVDILMATYNGSKYLSEQINSIVNQTYKNWMLYIRDDGSDDDTLNIIKEFSDKYPDKIILIEDNKSGLGAKNNFAELLLYSKNKYCMFCDQDDIWLNNKIEISINNMISAENLYGNRTPILVHTNLKVVDENLKILDNSYWKFQGLNGSNRKINKLMVENNITGCTMIINKALKEKIVNIPKYAIMHDWWIGLIASTLGKIVPIQESTILYRQHGNNEVGAKNINSIELLISKLNYSQINSSINNSIKQAKAFYKLYNTELNNTDKLIIEDFVNIKDKNFIIRKIIAIKNKFYKNNLIKKIVYLLFI